MTSTSPRPKGLRDFTASDSDIQTSAVFTAGSVPAEGGTHYTTGMGLLGNGTWGDCYWAASGRLGHTDSVLGGRDRGYNEAETVLTYEGYLGKKLTQQTDEGTDARAGAKYLVQHGINDMHGTPWHIGAYGFESDATKLPGLINAGLGVIVCIELTEGNEEEFNTAEREGVDFQWDLTHGNKVVGGHAIPGTFWTPDGIGVNSWDREGIVTYDYLAKYMQTAVVFFSSSILDKDGDAPDGLDKEKLIALVEEATKD